MNNKRNLKRRHLFYYLRVFNRATGEVLGHLVDMTTQGINLISEKPIETDTIFQLQIELPEEVAEQGKVSFDAESVKCVRDINPDFFSTGFKIVNIDQDNTQILQFLISDFGFVD